MTEVCDPRAATSSYVRTLARGDLELIHELLDRQPLIDMFVRHRVDSTRLDRRWFGAELWGWFEDGALRSLLHVGANVVPAQATPEAISAFGRRLLDHGHKPSSLVGPASAVLPLWDIVKGEWGPARSPRPVQPFMVLEHDSDVQLDPRVRPVRIDQVDELYPACVAMFTEEVGVHPESVGNPAGYRARVTQLVSMGWSWAIIEDGTVLFKTEVGAATDRGCQLQGVWVHPDLRGTGVAAPALASVVRQARRSVAPSVTLYVNDHNIAARRAYERVGFREVETFASILL
ncbi:GNAT family N-acetyltransferase [Aeromicrobium sp. 179-A 4D2 NHS]|uniref:GNAT family N-acetyltransferase n=1 Tax=Aeromicrobium sp. 179-A 4D2 NHS TaxID=3142375 RepID=UPI00399FCA67